VPRWLHRTTKQQLNSVSSASLPEPEVNYIFEPDYSAVSGQPVRYWLITGDVVSLADQPARDAIDAAIESARLDGLSDEVRTDDLIRAIAKTNLDLFNAERAARGASQITAIQYRANVRGNL